jgi:hypothetical protein
MASNAPISFIPQEQDLAIYQGGPVNMTFTCTDGVGGPINMTGGTILATIRQAQSHSSPLIATFTSTWVDQANGIFTLSLTSAQTDALTFNGNANWDCFYVDANTPVNYNPLFWGVVTMQGDISY